MASLEVIQKTIRRRLKDFNINDLSILSWGMVESSGSLCLEMQLVAVEAMLKTPDQDYRGPSAVCVFLTHCSPAPLRFHSEGPLFNHLFPTVEETFHPETSFGCSEDWVSFANCVLGIVWAWNFSGFLAGHLFSTAQRVLRDGSKQMDERKGTRPEGLFVRFLSTVSSFSVWIHSCLMLFGKLKVSDVSFLCQLARFQLCLMPGILTKKQIEAFRRRVPRGAEIPGWFLTCQMSS